MSAIESSGDVGLRQQPRRAGGEPHAGMTPASGRPGLAAPVVDWPGGGCGRRRRRRPRAEASGVPGCAGRSRAAGVPAAGAALGRAPGGVDAGADRRPRALSRPSRTPSPSSSPGQPRASTVAPLGVSEQRSSPSGMASPSLSRGQPVGSTSTPDSVSGQRSRPSAMLSPSESRVQPVALTSAPGAVLAQRSTPSGTPSASLSLGQPLPSTWAPEGVSGQRSRFSRMPSPSLSGIGLLPEHVAQAEAHAHVGERAATAPLLLPLLRITARSPRIRASGVTPILEAGARPAGDLAVPPMTRCWAARRIRSSHRPLSDGPSCAGRAGCCRAASR